MRRLGFSKHVGISNHSLSHNYSQSRGIGGWGVGGYTHPPQNLQNSSSLRSYNGKAGAIITHQTAPTHRIKKQNKTALSQPWWRSQTLGSHISYHMTCLPDLSKDGYGTPGQSAAWERQWWVGPLESCVLGIYSDIWRQPASPVFLQFRWYVIHLHDFAISSYLEHLCTSFLQINSLARDSSSNINENKESSFIIKMFTLCLLETICFIRGMFGKH